MTGPSASPRGEKAGTPGTRWETRLVVVETFLPDGASDDDTPPPRPNRATRRALKQRSNRRAPPGAVKCWPYGSPDIPRWLRLDRE